MAPPTQGATATATASRAPDPEAVSTGPTATRIGGRERETSLGRSRHQAEQARIKHAVRRAEASKKIDPVGERKARWKTWTGEDRRADVRRDSRQVHRRARRRDGGTGSMRRNG